MTTSGIIYITAGKTYTEDACHAAESARATNPGLGIDLFCDDPSIVPEGLFDKHMLSVLSLAGPAWGLVVLAALIGWSRKRNGDPEPDQTASGEQTPSPSSTQ